MTETDISGLEKLEAEQRCERCGKQMTHLWGHLLLEFWNIPAEHERSVLDIVEGLEKRALCWHCFVELLATLQRFFHGPRTQGGGGL